MIYETRLDPPLPRARFLLRLAGHGLAGIGIAGVLAPVIQRAMHLFHWKKEDR
jgi:hypothetical protein